MKRLTLSPFALIILGVAGSRTLASDRLMQRRPRSMESKSLWVTATGR